ncbi:MAG: hypothetical protein JSS74_03510 [Actinobacteria bacterium]|nr:hypothetical protein [Actinomycetota bacterium]
MGEEVRKNISRRTLVKGAAWSVPLVAVASMAPFAAASGESETPTFNNGLGCASTGTGSGCLNTEKTPQIPFAIKNTSSGPLVFQVTGAKWWNSNQNQPDDWSTGFRLFANNGKQSSCPVEYNTTVCDAISVSVPAGETVSLWLVGTPLQSAGAFMMSVQYQWVDSQCNVVVPQDSVLSAVIPSSANCK